MDELDDEHASIAAAARVFAEEQIAPYSREWDRAEIMDRSVVGKLADVGFLGAPIPEAYGGAGMDALGYCLVVEELGRVDSSVRGVVTVNTGLVAKSVLAWGTEEQRRRWLPGLCRGEPLGCFALTEPDHGSDAGNLTARAVRDGDHWVVSGSKVFITNGTWAGLALVFARTGEAGPAGISAFLVPTDADGFTAHPIKGKLGLRAQDTAEITLTDVHVPDDHRLGEIGDGFRIAMSALDAGRMSMGAACVGIAQACLDAATSYASQRHTFGRPIAERQLVQELIADIAVEVVAARLLTWRAAAAADAGKRHTVESSMAKYFASEAAVRAANSAMQVFGGYGYVDEFPVGRFLRDARVTTLYEGTSQLQKLIIGRHLTGHNALI